MTQKRFLWFFVFLLLTLAIVFAAFFYLYTSFRTKLDEELGARLTAVASGTAATINGSVWDGIVSGDSLARGELLRDLSEINDANELSNIFVFDDLEVTVMDLRGVYIEGEPNPLLALDVVAATTALAGVPAYTNLYESEDTFFKSGYAPVLSTNGTVVGGVGVEADAAFFEALGAIRQLLLGSASLVTLGMLFLGAGFLRVQQLQGGLEQRLRRTETLATMGQMTAMMAHEIRNPLGIIRGAAETLGDKYEIKEDEIFQFIPEEVDRLHGILSSYLDFARTDTAQTEDVGEALRRTLQVAKQDLDRKNIQVEVDIEDSEFPIRAGSQLLQQAFLNVILNAKDAMPEGGTLTVELKRDRGRAHVVFGDTGMGMPEDIRKKAMDPFFTNKEKGSGLGLAVVQRVASDAGGKVQIESRENQGTQISLWLPLKEKGEA